MLPNSITQAQPPETDSQYNLNQPETAATPDLEFYAIIEQDGSGGFYAAAPQFESCHSRGQTLAELTTNMQSAIRRSLSDTGPDSLSEIIGVYKIQIPADAASKNQGFYVLIKDDQEGGFIGIAPELKGCLSYGFTLDELVSNMEEAILLCLQDGDDAANPAFFGIQKVAIPKTDHLKI